MGVEEKYDVIVVGGGHAGCEAAHAAATLGSQVLLISRSSTYSKENQNSPKHNIFKAFGWGGPFELKLP